MILYVAWRRFKIVMSEQEETVDIKKKVISTGTILSGMGHIQVI